MVLEQKAFSVPYPFNRSFTPLAQAVLDSAEATAGSRRSDSSIPQKVFERRSEARYPAQDPAEIEVVPGPGTPIYGTVVDVSRSGLRVAIPRHLERGQHVKITLHNTVIVGEVRHCRAFKGGFQAGMRIRNLERPEGRENEHLVDDTLSLYAVGKGLSVPEVIDLREHLSRCRDCRARLAEKEAALNPARKRHPLA